MEFNSNNNKELIWNLLQESNIFQGIDDKQFPIIQSILEIYNIIIFTFDIFCKYF